MFIFCFCIALINIVLFISNVVYWCIYSKFHTSMFSTLLLTSGFIGFNDYGVNHAIVINNIKVPIVNYEIDDVTYQYSIDMNNKNRFIRLDGYRVDNKTVEWVHLKNSVFQYTFWALIKE